MSIAKEWAAVMFFSVSMAAVYVLNTSVIL